LNREAVTLIFDIGKTTKKALLFDRSFHVLEEHTDRLPEVPDDDGFPGEDINLLSKWVYDAIDRFQHHPKYLVTHINFSAYGASLVHLNKEGEIMPPFYNYLKPFPDDCKERLLKDYNRNNDLSTTTASPFLGLLNSGLQLFWLKYKKKQVFDDIRTSLHFPQYFTYLISGKKFSDITSVGCHTMLWDFDKKDYHEWVDREQLRPLLPSLHHADFTLDHMLGQTPVKIGIGVHDSSAALMPYLAVMKEQFLLLSTGTWNICFNPFNHDSLEQNELSQDCLCFLTFDGKPIKASIIFLGHEHELQQQAMAKYFNVNDDYYKSIDFNPVVYNLLRHNPAHFRVLGMQGSGPALSSPSLPTDYSIFENFEQAQHQLIAQLVRWQKISIDLVDPQKTVKKIIVVGGFTKSKLFLEIMKQELPERQILISDHPRASALGAAWLVVGKKEYADKHKVLNLLEA
jgi:sugar (pentulose or hexulose) kinase